MWLALPAITLKIIPTRPLWYYEISFLIFTQYVLNVHSPLVLQSTENEAMASKNSNNPKSAVVSKHICSHSAHKYVEMLLI